MKRTLIGLGGALLTLGGAWVVAQETLPASGTKQPAGKPTTAELYSYAIGIDMGKSFNRAETPLNIESLVAGVQDGLTAVTPSTTKQPVAKRYSNFKCL